MDSGVRRPPASGSSAGATSLGSSEAPSRAAEREFESSISWRRSKRLTFAVTAATTSLGRSSLAVSCEPNPPPTVTRPAPTRKTSRSSESAIASEKPQSWTTRSLSASGGVEKTVCPRKSKTGRGADVTRFENHWLIAYRTLPRLLLRCPGAVTPRAVPLVAQSQPRPAPSPVAADPSPAIGLACDASVRRPVGGPPAVRSRRRGLGGSPSTRTKARNDAEPWRRAPRRKRRVGGSLSMLPSA